MRLTDVSQHLTWAQQTLETKGSPMLRNKQAVKDIERACETLKQVTRTIEDIVYLLGDYIVDDYAARLEAEQQLRDMLSEYSETS